MNSNLKRLQNRVSGHGSHDEKKQMIIYAIKYSPSIIVSMPSKLCGLLPLSLSVLRCHACLSFYLSATPHTCSPLVA
jgi:hypothetical protein